MTVFAPAPVNPPAMPWTSSVGRDQTRSSTVRSGSPVSCGRADFFGQELVLVERQRLPALQFRGGGLLHVVVDARESECARRRDFALASSSISPNTAFGAAPPYSPECRSRIGPVASTSM